MQLRPPPSVLPMALMCPHSSGRDKRERFLKHTPGTLTRSLFLTERETLAAMDQKAPAAALLLGTGTRRAWGALAAWEAAAQLHGEVASAQRGAVGPVHRPTRRNAKSVSRKETGPADKFTRRRGKREDSLVGTRIVRASLGRWHAIVLQPGRTVPAAWRSVRQNRGRGGVINV